MTGRVAFIGVGIMGFPMADHLIGAGYSVGLYDTIAEKCAPLAAKGAIAATSVQDAVRGADVVFTVLPNETIIFEAILGESGAIDSAKPGCIFSNCSTVYPTANIKLGEALAKRGFQFLDAPVTGSGAQAQDATLLFLVSGGKNAFDEVLPLYRAMGKDALYAGPSVGTASYAKICSNAMMAMNMTAFGEALTMAVKAGVDPQTFIRFCAGGGARNAMAESKIEKIMDRDFSPTFRTELMLKDTTLAAVLAQELDVPTPSLNLTKEMYRIACLEGLQDEDHCSVIKCYEKWAGIEIGRKGTT